MLRYIPLRYLQVAATYVGEDDELQRSLLTSMLAAGELSLARQQQQLFGLEAEFQIHPERLAEEQAARRERYLQMPLPPGALHYVQCAGGLAAMALRLQALLRQPTRHGAAHSPADATADAGVATAAPQRQQQADQRQAAAPGGRQDGVPAAAAAAAAFAGAHGDEELLPVLGLDLEWQPDGENSSPPSLLQISTGAV